MGNTKTNYVALVLIDYNAAEAVLLACAVLVCLSGIMFLSGRFEGENLAMYEQEYNRLAIVVACLVMLSLAYFMTVLFFEIFWLMNKEAADRCVQMCNKRAAAMQDAKSKGKSSGGDLGDMSYSERQQASRDTANGRSMTSSPLVQSMVERGESRISNSELDSMVDPPNRMQWTSIRNEHRAMRERLEEMQREMQVSKRETERGSTNSLSTAGNSVAAAAIARQGALTAARSGRVSKNFGMRQAGGSRLSRRGSFGVSSPASSRKIKPLGLGAAGLARPDESNASVNPIATAKPVVADPAAGGQSLADPVARVKAQEGVSEQAKPAKREKRTERVHVEGLPDGWEARKDKKSGRVFYRNKETGKKQWKRPKA